jgi:hypothetical protein
MPNPPSIACIRSATTRGGNQVRILLDLEDTVVGVYWSDNDRLVGWVPAKWSKLSPFYNGSGPSGLDLLESIPRMIFA